MCVRWLMHATQVQCVYLNRCSSGLLCDWYWLCFIRVFLRYSTTARRLCSFERQSPRGLVDTLANCASNLEKDVTDKETKCWNKYTRQSRLCIIVSSFFFSIGYLPINILITGLGLILMGRDFHAQNLEKIGCVIIIFFF